MIKNLLFTAMFSIIALGASAQCLDWVNPAPDAGWIDFGSAPCDGDSMEIEAFEVVQSEAYAFANVVTGGNYTFSMCNGPGAGTWIPEFTIITPSGEVDAFGAGDGDGCSITWNATEDGTYLVVINEAGNCGVEGSDSNGYPKIKTNSGGIPCEADPVMIDGAESFEADTLLPDCWQTVDADGDGYDWNIITNEDIAFDGMNTIRSESYRNLVGALTPDNYLITPDLEIVDGDSLYYVVNSIDADYAAENYTVLVSTSGTDVADFTDEVFTEVLEDGDFHGRSVDLSAYDGQTINIAFRHHDVTDQFAFSLDAIYLPGVNCVPDGITELENIESDLYPNPTTGTLNITSSLQGAATVTVFDAVGRVVLQDKVNLTQATYTQNVSTLDNGMYTIRIHTANKVATERFVKQ